MTGVIFDVKEMAVHDGPGIRTTVFLKGCPLRCKWCHNPEGLMTPPQLMFKKARCRGCGLCQKPCQHSDCQVFGRCLHICSENCLEISGREVSPQELAKELKRSAKVLGDDFGGFTFSGGEPLMQAEFLRELTEELKEYHLCIETCGYAPKEVFQKAVENIDFVIMDIKLADRKRHQEYTGVSNEIILRNFRYLRQSGKPYLIRTPLIPEVTDTEENLAEIEGIIGDSPWEKLSYNAVAGAKYEMLGMEYPLAKRFYKKESIGKVP